MPVSGAAATFAGGEDHAREFGFPPPPMACDRQAGNNNGDNAWIDA